MKKVIGLIFSAGLIAGLLSIAACSDDPPPKRNLAFAEAAVTVNEADGVIEIEVVLDRPALEDVTIDYELAGNATDTEVDPDFSDYLIVEDNNDYGEIEIAKGETVGVIQIEIFADLEFEDTETIEISLIGTDSEKVLLTREDEIEISIEQEDGLVIVLDWAQTTVDLDLLVRYGTTMNNWLGVLTGSLYGQPEIAFIPNTMDDGAFGMSYTYYAGTTDPLNFTVDFIKYVNGAIEPEANWDSFNATYTQANVNEWEDISTTKVVQTFTKAGDNFSGFSAITVPSSGSKIEFQKIPSDPIKIEGIVKSKALKR